MISLTLLPSQGQASKVGPSNPIVGASTQRPTLERPAGGSLSFSSRFRQKEELKEKDPRDGKVKVKLADSSVLVPFYDRSTEVKELLMETNKNKQLLQSLQDLFFSSPDEWTRLQKLLFESNRDQFTDREWLAQLYLLVFARSPCLWCRLADCLGAHLLDWSSFQVESQLMGEGEDEEEVESLKYDDVFSDTSSSVMTEYQTYSRNSSSGLEFEALHEVPMTFRTAPTRVRKHSYRYDENTSHEDTKTTRHQPLRHRRGSSVISTGHDDDVDDFLSTKRDGFAGIRLSCSTFANRGRNISAPSTVKAIPTQEKATSHLRQRGATVSGHQYVHHRRLSSLFLTPSDKAVDAKGKESKDKSSARSTSPPKLASPSSSFARTFSAPRMTSERKPSQERTKQSPPPSSDRTLGLLPDGRTRHPSAGDGEGSKEALALLAFKRELQLSDYPDDGINSTKDQNRVRSSSTPTSSLFSPPISEDSFATNVSPSNSSPVITKDFPLIDRPPAHSRREDQQQNHHLIFPISPKYSISRSQHLMDQLENKDNLITEIKQIIGQMKYQEMVEMIMKNERSHLSDQSLLEQIAQSCFSLIDQEKETNLQIVEEYLLDEDYEKRWNTFVKLCNTWDVDSAVIREAKRRGGPAVKLF